MTEQREPVLTGGCQCGAVRYAFYVEPISADICHCRMCQRALGNVFAPFTGVRLGDFAWTRGEPATWQSSSIAERGFCGRCGTPLSFRYLARDKISVTIGSLDEPARVRPTEQAGSRAACPGCMRRWLCRQEHRGRSAAGRRRRARKLPDAGTED